jgi:oxygen-independent coproporphyrinogen-3 oxidase
MCIRDRAGYAALLARGTDPLVELESFDQQGAMAETLYLGLRTAKGIDDHRFRERFGLGVAEAFPAAVARAGQRLRCQGGHWLLDLEGWLLYDHLIAPFL